MQSPPLDFSSESFFDDLDSSRCSSSFSNSISAQSPRQLKYNFLVDKRNLEFPTLPRYSNHTSRTSLNQPKEVENENFQLEAQKRLDFDTDEDEPFKTIESISGSQKTDKSEEVFSIPYFSKKNFFVILKSIIYALRLTVISKFSCE